jgi:hypothetical protein
MLAIAGEPSGFQHFVDGELSTKDHIRASLIQRIANGGEEQSLFSRQRQSSRQLNLVLAQARTKTIK